MEEFNESLRQHILIDSPLYTEFDSSQAVKQEVGQVFMRGSVECYCPDCKKVSVFKLKTPFYNFTEEVDKAIPTIGVFTVVANCMRDASGSYKSHCDFPINIVFRLESEKIIKIGQFPSRAEIDFGVLDKSFRELEDNQRKELGTAIGLHSHGIGIGSFVYLRRIFEGLIEEAHLKAKAASNWDEASYIRLRMNERILALKEQLPSRLVKTASLYGILSKGLHELSEDDCKAKFDLVRQAIQFILSERAEEKEYEKVAKKIEKEA